MNLLIKLIKYALKKKKFLLLPIILIVTLSIIAIIGNGVPFIYTIF